MALFNRTTHVISNCISTMQLPGILGAYLLALMAPALAQDYGAGWFDVSRGMGQAFGQQEALRDRMRMTREADPAEAATAPVADELADALRHAAGTSQARITPPEITAIARFKASPAVENYEDRSRHRTLVCSWSMLLFVSLVDEVVSMLIFHAR